MDKDKSNFLFFCIIMFIGIGLITLGKSIDELRFTGFYIIGFAVLFFLYLLTKILIDKKTKEVK